MTDTSALTEFFAGWGNTNAEGRAKQFASAIGDSFYYADPHATDPTRSLDEFLTFVDAFAKNAPGATANVTEPVDLHNGHFRCTVNFVLGADMSMTGQYFGDLDTAGKITRMIGFVGKGPK